MIRKKFSSRRKVRKKAIFLRKWFLAMVLVGLIGLLVAYIGYGIVSKPYIERANGYDMELINAVELPSVIYDRNEREIGRIFVENRSPVRIEEIPQKMVDALVSGEDQRFFSHDGVDFIGIGRAAYLNLKSGAEDSGASSLTMQLARNAYNLKQEALDRKESSYERKLVEIYLAQRIEKYYTKQKILEFYLNRVAFGSGYYGVRTAALGYFGKEPKDLEVYECASLVASIRNPTYYSPLRNKTRNKEARDRVLTRMEIDGRISKEERDRYIAQPVVTNPKPIQRNTSYIYDRVAATVEKHVSSEQIAAGSLRIFTTVDKDVQVALEQSLEKQLTLAESQPGYKHPLHKDFRGGPKARPQYLQGAALMLNNKTGEVLGYVGGRDFSQSQYDFVEAGKKPSGTAFFPFIYAAALEAGENLSARVIDDAMDNRMVMIDGMEGILGEWGSEVSEPHYEGEVLLRHALAHSKIAATVRLGRRVGIGKVRKMAERFGFTMPKTQELPRELLGTESVSLPELVKSYAAFGNQGVQPTTMQWVTRIENGEGDVLFSNPQMDPKKAQKAVLHPATAYLVHSMLESALKDGSGKRGFDATQLSDFSGGGKTGTTSDFADNWFVGYNSEVSCGVWAGFHSGSRDAIYPGAFSVDTVFPVWARAMEVYQNKYHPKPVAKPNDVVSVPICKSSGLRISNDCEDYERNPETGKMESVSTATQEYYYINNKPLGYCESHGNVAVDSSAISLTQRFGSRSFSDVQPVQPVAPTLLGDDPYNSVQPDFVPKDHIESTASRGLDAINPDSSSDLDESSLINISRPGKVEIIAD